MQFIERSILNITIMCVLLLCGTKVHGEIGMGGLYEYDLSEDETAGRIVGGVKVDISEFPYQVFVKYDEGERRIKACGGSIINKNLILTAAHCAKNMLLANITVRVGSSYWNHGGNVHEVKSVFIHPQYKKMMHLNDVAVILLKKPIKFSFKTKPIKLAELHQPEPPIGSFATVSGWGIESHGLRNIPKHLRAVDVAIISNEDCKVKMRGVPINDKIICTGFTLGGKGICGGDSGGPLVMNGIQIGIASAGVKCGDENPDLFTSVAEMKNFISHIVSKVALKTAESYDNNF